MQIKIVVTGSIEENCYVLIKDNICVVIDPGEDIDKIKEAIGDAKLEAILITHNHFDHVGALDDLVSLYSVPVYRKDNLKEKEYQIEDFVFNVIFTPGHSSDAVTFYFPSNNVMFTGDFVFRGTVGRCDLPTGDEIEMDKSIDKIKKYPLDTVIYPGHGDYSTLGQESRNNPYF